MNSKAAIENRLVKYWNTILLWSGYEHYLEVREIARIQKIEPRTVSRRIQWFKKHYPEQHARIKQDRKSIKAASLRLDQQLEDMNNGKFVSYDALNSDIRDEIVKERF